MGRINRRVLRALAAIGVLLLGHVARAKPRMVDLIPLIDVDKDAVGGKWSLVDGQVRSDASSFARLRIPYEPPEEYDFRIKFIRTAGNNDVNQILRFFGSSCMWQMGAWDNTKCGFSKINGFELNRSENPTIFHADSILKNGQEYTSVVRVRKGSVVGLINDRVVSKCELDPSAFAMLMFWDLRAGGLGVGTWQSPTIFKSIDVVEISGPGKVLAESDSATNSGDKKKSEPAEEPKQTALHTDPALHSDREIDTTAIDGPASKIANLQATIKALEILKTDSGLMLGQTSETTLTVTRSETPSLTSVRFVTPVGDEMCLARDEALRYIRVTYPNWNAGTAEISFEDKYNGHDGGSIGAAIGTMVLSVIQGFQIDPDAAITGDISANGKVRAIGGVAAKLHGAVASKCSLVAIPADNYGQLVDAVIYDGPSIASDIQVIGIANLNDAVAVVRADRDRKLGQAIAMFETIRNSMKASPKYLQTEEAKLKLAKVLELAPNHLSAKLLLDIASGKQPKTLTATASMYYTGLAVQSMISVLAERQESREQQEIPSSVVRSGIEGLRKLLPIADTNVRPLINAWSKFIIAWDNVQQGEGTAETLKIRRQTLLDEMAHQNTNAELMQKMLREGF